MLFIFAYDYSSTYAIALRCVVMTKAAITWSVLRNADDLSSSFLCVARCVWVTRTITI